MVVGGAGPGAIPKTVTTSGTDKKDDGDRVMGKRKGVFL
jgi:hypothetical protein